MSRLPPWLLGQTGCVVVLTALLGIVVVIALGVEGCADNGYDVPEARAVVAHV
jgi:hypothetical protein